MDLIKIKEWETKDPVKTEETIIKKLRKLNISSHFLVADYHWADSINKKGVLETQKTINNYLDISKEKGKKIIFICQHISGEKLKWGDGIVFSPHSTSSNKFIPIPHYSCTYDDSLIKKDINVSFVGSLETHAVRRKIRDLYHHKWLIKDTGEWHFYNKEGKINREEYYKDTLSRSNITLCPRGTGPGSIRIWESLSSKSIPIVIGDNINLPYVFEGIIPIVSIHNVPVLDMVCEKILKNKSALDKMFDIHEKNTSNKNLHKIVEDYIRKIDRFEVIT